MNNYTLQILDALSIPPHTKLTSKIVAEELVSMILSGLTNQEIADKLSCSRGQITKANKALGLSKVVTRRNLLKVIYLDWCSYGLHVSEDTEGNNRCKDCSREYHSSLYNKHKDRILARNKEWKDNNKETRRAYKAQRRAAELQRTPEWSDIGAIREFYKSCPEGYEIDHIIPLQGENVSGLHILENLQYLTVSENRSKGNKFLT